MARPIPRWAPVTRTTLPAQRPSEVMAKVYHITSREREALAPDERAKVVALGYRVLARLVLGPAVRLGVAVTIDVSLVLARRGVPGLAAAIVRLELRGQIAIVVAVRVDRQRRRQAHAAPAGLRRIPDTESRHRKHARRQREQLRQLLDVVAHDADGAAAEPQRGGGR